MNATQVRPPVILLNIFLIASACPAQFATVINVPPSPAPTSIGSDTQLNVLEGGMLPSLFDFPFQVDRESSLKGLREGQTLTLVDGGVLREDFTAVNATLHVAGGVVRDNFEIAGSQLTISGGSVGLGIGGFSTFAGSHVIISGGTASRLNAYNDSDVHISGGSVGSIEAEPGSSVSISGGLVGGIITRSGSEVLVSGGTIERFGADGGRLSISHGEIGEVRVANSESDLVLAGGIVGSLQALNRSNVSIYGADFSLGGSKITNLRMREEFTITTRDVELTGTFADGSPFSFDLDSTPEFASLNGYMTKDVTLTVTRVSLLEADYNSNGTVEQADLDLVLLNWGEELFNPFAAGWINDLPVGVIDQ